MQSDKYLKTKCTILAINLLIGDFIILSLFWNTFLFVTFTSFSLIVFSLAAFLSFKKKYKMNTAPQVQPVETLHTEPEKQVPEKIGPPPSYTDITSREYI